MEKFPQGTEADVCADIAKRQEHGFAKYGTTVRDNPLILRRWIQHLYEELLDGAIYAKRAMEEMDKAPTADEVMEVASNFFAGGLIPTPIEKYDRRHNPCDYWGCKDLGLGHHLNCPNNPNRVLPGNTVAIALDEPAELPDSCCPNCSHDCYGEKPNRYCLECDWKEVETKKAHFYITTTHGMRGWVAVMIRVDPEGFEEPQQTHSASHADRYTAQHDAQAWAKDEELEYRP